MISFLKVEGHVIPMANLKEQSFGSKAGYQFDIRYACEGNFFKKKVYPRPECFLLRHVAEDLKKVHETLLKKGYGLLLFDGYRPWAVTKLFWDHSSEHDRNFLADPAKGSSHNRGCAVDLSLYELKTGRAVEMPSDFDEMNEKAYRDYSGGSHDSRVLRDLLRDTMEANHFKGIRHEWWHFNHESHHAWPVMNFSFEDILNSPRK